MVTNQVLTRKMGDFNVIQRTKDGMFNATELLKQWNKHSGMKKELKDFFENNSTKEFIKTIQEEEADLHRGNSPYVKSRASRGENAGTWMHPLLFIDFAMWLNASFKYHVLKFVYDQLIKFRNDAGDSYKEMSSAIAKLVPASELKQRIPEIARAVNYVVYNDHQTNIRNHQADESKAKKLTDIQKEIARLIDLGFISSFDALKSHVRKLYRENQLSVY